MLVTNRPIALWCWKCQKDTDDTDRHSGPTCNICGEEVISKRLITRIGKAYADGMPLPGEEDRFKDLPGFSMRNIGWMKHERLLEWLEKINERCEYQFELIALRKEEE